MKTYVGFAPLCLGGGRFGPQICLQYRRRFMFAVNCLKTSANSPVSRRLRKLPLLFRQDRRGMACEKTAKIALVRSKNCLAQVLVVAAAIESAGQGDLTE